jgi:hypothetical protein
MKTQLTEAQSFFDKDYTHRITLKYRQDINRPRDKAEMDIRMLQRRLQRKLFGRKKWDLLWFPSIENKNKHGEYVRLHFHLLVGALPEGARKTQIQVGARKIQVPLEDLIRNEWERMGASIKSKNPEVRSLIELIDREESIGYPTKSFGDQRHNKRQNYLANEIKKEKWKCWSSATRKIITQDIRDIKKKIADTRGEDLFACVPNTFFVK